MSALHGANAGHESAGFTGRYTAGLRYIESTCIPNPLLPSDPLAGVLAGDRGLALAKQELEQLIADQGPGKHLRVPARSRLIDHLLARELGALRSQKQVTGQGGFNRASSATSEDSGATTATTTTIAALAPGAAAPGQAHVQVVSLGAGMCTRPWRLPALAGCAVFELDLPHIAQTKRQLLAAAGARTTRGSLGAAVTTEVPAPLTRPHGDGTDARSNTQNQILGGATGAGSDTSIGGREGPAPPPSTGATGTAAPGASAFPLLASSYACVGLDLSVASPVDLATALSSAGFDRCTPTVWVLEALLYYMPLRAASELLCRLAELSAPGSRLIATCVDRELLEASIKGVPKGHVFADLWHFDTEALLYDSQAFATAWQLDWSQQPAPAAAAEEAAEAAVEQQDGEAKTEVAAAVAGEEGAAAAGDEPSCCRQQQDRRRLPASTRRLALDWLGAETYVALYGGSELLFTAGLVRGDCL